MIHLFLVGESKPSYALLAPGTVVNQYELTELWKSLGAGRTCASESSSPSSDDTSVMITGPTLEYQCIMEYSTVNEIYVNEHYHLQRRFAGGSHGEIWRAEYNGETFILKRIFIEKGPHILRTGLREIHYGTLLQDEPHVAQFVEHFYHPGEHPEPDLWLVFQDEGQSLRQYLYSQTETHGSVIFQPSKYWTRWRTEKGGPRVLREIIRQVLEGIQTLHARGITHRDIKPSNVLIHTATTSTQRKETAVKLADFGSAVDGYTLRELYDEDGPSQAEETREYQPPEVLFGIENLAYDSSIPTSYDMWSVGVLFLELFLASPEVFVLSPRARAELDFQLQGKTPMVRRKSYVLHALAEFCLYRPTDLPTNRYKYALISQSCHLGIFKEAIRKRDPLDIGLEDRWALELLWDLLQWDPAQRISAKDALSHAYFKGPYTCSSTGREFGSLDALQRHEAYLVAQSRLKEEHAARLIVFSDIPHEFHCPLCGRTFDLWPSCETHLRARHKHASYEFCTYEIDRVCSVTHDLDMSSMDAFSDTFGYFQMAGRRPYMEDVHIVSETSKHIPDKHDDEPGGEPGDKPSDEPVLDVYALMDGHLGLGTASFLQEHVIAITRSKFTPLATSGSLEEETLVFRQIFLELQETFLANADLEKDFSGSTMTIVVRFHDRLVVANVGDSTAYITYTEHSKKKARQVSKDHMPNEPMERKRVEESGGFIEYLGVWRVMGQLAISRSFGDHHLRQYVSTEPFVTNIALHEETSPTFFIMATDGVWETLDIDTVQKIVHLHLNSEEDSTRALQLHQAASAIIFEAYVRGSTDNMAVLIVDLQ